MVSTALSRRLKLTAPVLAVGVVAAGITVPRLADAADASASLPPRTAEQLLVDVSEADVEGLSGTVVLTSRTGLPELPSDGGGGSALSLTGLLSGSTTAHVWKAGDDRSRVALPERFAEYDVVRDGDDVWTYDSASSEVTHLVLAESAGAAEPAPATPGAATPQDVAAALLSSVTPSTTVTVGSAEEVAGRPAYELVLEPKPGQVTLVEAVRIAVDGDTGVPLRVRAFAVGQPEPAVEVAFTSVEFEVPDDSVFAFAPPPGSTVTERSFEDHDATKEPGTTSPAPSAVPQVLGSGWSTVVETTGVQVPEDEQGMLAQLSTPVEGGRAISSALLSVLLTDDGRMLVGPVPTAELERLARR